MFRRRNDRKSRSKIKSENENRNHLSEKIVPKVNGNKEISILESMKMHQLLLLYSGLASVGIGKKISTGAMFRTYQILIFVSYIPVLTLQIYGSYHYGNDTLLLFDSLVPYVIIVITHVCPMSINWERTLELIYILEEDSVFSRISNETNEKKKQVLKQAIKRVIMIFYVSIVGISFCGISWFFDPYIFKMLEHFTADPNLNTNTTELDPLKIYTTIFWYPDLDLTTNPNYLIIQSFVFVLIIFIVSKVTVTFTFTMALIVYVYEMFELVSISIQDIDKLHTNQRDNNNLPMTNNLQKPFYGEDMSDREGLGSDNIEKFINIEEDADLQLMDGENELKANELLKNAVKDHQQVIK